MKALGLADGGGGSTAPPGAEGGSEREEGRHGGARWAREQVTGHLGHRHRAAVLRRRWGHEARRTRENPTSGWVMQQDPHGRWEGIQARVLHFTDENKIEVEAAAEDRGAGKQSSAPSGSLGGGGGGWHKASVSDCLPLAASIGLSPLLIRLGRGGGGGTPSRLGLAL